MITMSLMDNLGGKFSKIAMFTAINQLFRDLNDDRDNTVCVLIRMVKDAKNSDKYDVAIERAGKYLRKQYNARNVSIKIDDNIVNIIIMVDDNPSYVCDALLNDITGFIDVVSGVSSHDVPQFSFDISYDDSSVIITLPIESEKIMTCLEESDILPFEINC